MIWSQADDPTAGGRFRSLKASPSPFDQCWNRGLQTVDTARSCVSPLSGNQSVWVGDDCFHLQPPFYVKLLLEKRVDPVLGWCIFTYTYMLQEWNVVQTQATFPPSGKLETKGTKKTGRSTSKMPFSTEDADLHKVSRSSSSLLNFKGASQCWTGGKKNNNSRLLALNG